MNDRRLIALLLAAASMLALAGCKRPETPPEARMAATNQQIYQVKGVVREVHPERNKVKVAHEEIPGYMEAMTMMLDVKEAKELDGLQVGDMVSFRMIVTEDDGWIDQITKLSSGSTIESSAPPPFRQVREVEPLEVGDVMPDYPFTNQLGQLVRLSDFKGQAMALTFIFTRCPFPNFCPRMNENFQTAHNKLKAVPNGPTNWHLLTISFDPQFDTPATLRAYAKRYKYDPNHWSFLTGDLTEITAITEQFGLQFWKDGGSINHNLRTVVIDAQGRVQWIKRENEWKPDELVAEMIKAANPAQSPPTGG
jgi:protein SCO1/2